MSTNKKQTAKKKSSTSSKKAAPKKKKSIPKVDKIEIDVPDVEEVKVLVADTWKQIQADDFKLTKKTQQGLVSKIKSWFKVS